MLWPTSASLVGTGRAGCHDRGGRARLRVPARPTRRGLVRRCRAHLQQAVAAQWDPGPAIPWDAPFELADEVEDAVVQVMTYLIENETAALMVPAVFSHSSSAFPRSDAAARRSSGRRGPPHRSVHAPRQAQRSQLGLSTVGGQASLKTLVDEPDSQSPHSCSRCWAKGVSLAAVVLERYAPDPVTATVARLAAQDEARHVAFGLAHLSEHLALEPGFRRALRHAVAGVTMRCATPPASTTRSSMRCS